MTDYALMIEQVKSLAEVSSELISLMANVAALLFHGMENINWAGFYLVKDDALLLGPFQGNVACVKIAKGKGVCGTAWEQDKIWQVDDVHTFPGHIACDSASRSEIVLPLHRGGEVIAVLDIDSPILRRFGEEDKKGLAALVCTMEKIIANA